MIWKLDFIDLNVIAAFASAIGAIAAAWAAFASRSTSQKALSLQLRLYLYESLKACAQRANSYSDGKVGSDWEFHDAANIVRSITLAMEVIQEHSTTKDEKDLRGFKHYFTSLLNMELFEELNRNNAPDGIFQKTQMDVDGVEVWNSWLRAREYFEFSNVTDEDLSN